ncbi:MAG: hypothetical protein Q7S80_01540 [bacterium]|nr:hypothetical protein [bacterium]
MILTAHLIAGGAAGELVGNPAGAFLAGIILHFILDAIPHYDTVDKIPHFSRRQVFFTTTEIIIGILILLFVIKLPLNRSILNSNFAWGALGGLAPDLLDNVPFWEDRFVATKFGRKFHHFHHAIHKKQPGIVVGMATQIITIALFLAIHFAIIK